MKKPWNHILMPAKIALATDSLFLLLVGLPALFLGNPLESFDVLVELGLASRIVFGFVVLCCIVTSVGFSVSLYRLLVNYNWGSASAFFWSVILFIALGTVSYFLSILTVVLVAFGGW